MTTYSAKCESCDWKSSTKGSGREHSVDHGHKVTVRTVTTYIPSTPRAPKEGRLESMIGALDAAGVPTTAGAVVLRRTLREMGHPVSNRFVAELARTRKASI